MANLSKKKKYHYIYKTTCLLNGKYYIGMHSTNNLDDGYLGSGTRLRLAIRKHGKENFKKEILEFCNSFEEVVQREKEIVHKDLIKDDLCMNLKEGGRGGYFKSEFYKEFQQKGNEARAYKQKYDENYILNKKAIGSSHFKKLWQTEEFKKIASEKRSFQGKKHTEETKAKMREKAKVNSKGERNSQFGTCWVTKDGINKKIKREQLLIYTNQGWIAGRKSINIGR